eukprot:2458605-Pyramimonas_sp.AAC.1
MSTRTCCSYKEHTNIFSKEQRACNKLASLSEACFKRKRCFSENLKPVNVDPFGPPHHVRSSGGGCGGGGGGGGDG